MPRLATSSFFGISPKIEPRYLREGAAQIANNCEAVGRSLKPLNALSAAMGLSVSLSDSPKTIYLLDDPTGESEFENLWLSWDSDVKVARSQIADDRNGWVFYTGDGFPKASNWRLAIGEGPFELKLPRQWIALGVPTPTQAPIVRAKDYVPILDPAEIYLAETDLGLIDPAWGIRYSTDGGTLFKYVETLNNNVETVRAALDAQPDLMVEVVGSGLTVRTTATGPYAHLDIVLKPPTWVDRYAPPGAGAGVAPALTITSAYITKLSWANPFDPAKVPSIAVATNGGDWRWVRWTQADVSADDLTPTILAAQINKYASDLVTATVSGVDVVLTGLATGADQSIRAKVAYLTYSTVFPEYPPTVGTKEWAASGAGASGATTSITITPVELETIRIDWGILYSSAGHPAYGDANSRLSGLVARDAATVALALNGLADGVGNVIAASVQGENVVVSAHTAVTNPVFLRWCLDYGSDYSAVGLERLKGNLETRYYAYTWVLKVDDYEMESAPSPASVPIELYHAQACVLSDIPAGPEDWRGQYPPTAVRIYRSVAGTFLFEDEIDVSEIPAPLPPTGALPPDGGELGVTGTSTLIGPSGATDTATPTYTWEAIPGATWYQLWVGIDGQEAQIDKWYELSKLTYNPAANTYSVTPRAALADGTRSWWIQGYDDTNGEYGWSAPTEFTVTAGLTIPGAATLVSPAQDDVNTDRTPTYVWMAVTEASWYQLWVDDQSGEGLIQAWYRADELEVGPVAGSLQVTPPIAVRRGYVSWWIQTWNDAGEGPWSEPSTFTCDAQPWLQYESTKLAEELGEVIPSLFWSPPPEDMQGLVNMANGMMAGFVGRDLYFCEPYIPHAWPTTYNLTMDHKIVALAALDTTLVVLTEGQPYFVAGAHPSAMVQQKTGIEQACVSANSVVTLNGAVFYASPDGLMSVSPGSSDIVTKALFDREQWRAMINPTTLKAWAHDLRYHGFYARTVLGDLDAVTPSIGGFVLDLQEGSLTFHDIPAQAGYADLYTDTLYIYDGELRTWGDGLAKTFTWKSKLHTAPQILGWSCAQVEAEAYPLTFRLFVDGDLTYFRSVTERKPFRLPPTVGRDTEIELVSAHEVYNMVVSTSMTEIASA